MLENSFIDNVKDYIDTIKVSIEKIEYILNN
jgi:hypothetical protein